jgi:uncharacterized phage protein gp47/JayE
MSTAFRLKTFPEILANMFATARVLIDSDSDLNVGSAIRTFIEMCALQDADQYLQISKLLNLFALKNCKGVDVDKRALDYGADIFSDLRRRQAKTSIVKISVSDGTAQVRSALAADVLAGAFSFSAEAGEGALYPSSGSMVLERATAREEQVVYSRTGDVFSVLSSSTGLVYAHAIGGELLRISTKSILASGELAGSLSATLATGTGVAWPLTGTIIFERGSIREEKKTFSRVADVLTLGSALGFPHAVETDVILSTAGADRAISSGTQVFAPPSETTKKVLFRTTEAGTLFDGDITSGLINAESDLVGKDTRVGSNTVTQFASAPFSGATVTNPVAATRGANREEDEPYIQRIVDFIQSLSRGTALSIETLVAGLRDEVSNQEVEFAQTLEPVGPGMALLYITDGTPTFALDRVVFLGRDVIISDAEAGDQRGRLANFAPFDKVASPVNLRTPRIWKSDHRGSATSVGVNFLEDTSLALTPGAEVNKYLKTDDDQFYLITGNTAIRYTLSAGGATPSLGSYATFDFSTDPLEPGVDYAFNETNGDLELVTALVAHDSLVAASDGASPSVGAYRYTEGLGAFVQRTVNGDRTDIESFPGIKALGTQVLVVAPSVVSPTIQIKVIAQRGFTDVELSPSVKAVVQTYVNSLGIGENIILSEIIKLVKELPGVADVQLIFPTTNITVPAGQLARIDDSNVVVL